MEHKTQTLTSCELLFLTQLSKENEVLMADGQSVASLLRRELVELGELGWAITEAGRAELRLAVADPPRSRQRSSMQVTARERADDSPSQPHMTFWVAAPR
jgi:hypothetical protein